MNNEIFKNTYFGKAYKTRDGRKAIYIGSTYKNDHALHIDKNGSVFSNDIYNDNGKMVNNKSQADTPYDIVSEWREPIGKIELDKLAYDYCPEERTWGDNNITNTEYIRAIYRRRWREALSHDCHDDIKTDTIRSSQPQAQTSRMTVSCYNKKESCYNKKEK